MIIGITGGTGSGKTTALKVFESLGAVAVDCDEIYHRLLNESEEMLREICVKFPSSFPEGIFDRKRLGSIVFNNADALSELNSITHKYVTAEVDKVIKQTAGKGHVAIDAIALIESGTSEKCDCIIGVIAPRQLRISRIMRRENISADYAASRIDSQKDDNFYRENCHYLLESTDGDLEIFKSKCRQLFKIITKEKENGQ